MRRMLQQEIWKLTRGSQHKNLRKMTEFLKQEKGKKSLHIYKNTTHQKSVRWEVAANQMGHRDLSLLCWAGFWLCGFGSLLVHWFLVLFALGNTWKWYKQKRGGGSPSACCLPSDYLVGLHQIDRKGCSFALTRLFLSPSVPPTLPTFSHSLCPYTHTHTHTLAKMKKKKQADKMSSLCLRGQAPALVILLFAAIRSCPQPLENPHHVCQLTAEAIKMCSFL